MLRLLADTNFNADIVRGVLRRNPEIDFIRAQEVGLDQVSDPTMLEWAAHNGRLIFTHDVSTMTHYASRRIAAGLGMPGLFEVSRAVPIRQAIEDILLIAECSVDGEWEGQILYLPLR
jgi:hypothetical protein